MLRVLVLVVCLLITGCHSPAAERPSVLFLMLDTLRADHLGVYGYQRETSPNLDAFAAENLRAAYNVTPSPWTPPSVASMFTGVYPITHGVMPPNDRGLAKKAFVRIPDSFETLAERLKAHGYRTGAVTPNPWTTAQFGYAQGFDQFYHRDRARADEINRATLKVIDGWLAEDRRQPFFMYAHYLDPHDPYDPPGEYRSMFQGSNGSKDFEYNEKMVEHINLYDGEIRFLDFHLGELFSALKQRGIYDELAIVVIADHGEQFLEHGHVRHGNQLHNEEVHVPFMVKAPKSFSSAEARGVLEETTSSVDLYPTVCALVGVKPPEGLPGVSILDRGATSRRTGVMSEIAKVNPYQAMVSTTGRKLIVTLPRDEGVEEGLALFDRRTGYPERLPIAASEEELRGMRDQLRREHAAAAALRPGDSGPAVEVESETIEQLQSLGYLK